MTDPNLPDPDPWCRSLASRGPPVPTSRWRRTPIEPLAPNPDEPLAPSPPETPEPTLPSSPGTF